MRKGLGGALLVAGLVLAASCGTGEPPVLVAAREARLSEQNTSLGVSLLRLSMPDFPAYDSPEALAADRSIVVAGVIDGWQQGPATETYENGPLDYRVVLRVRITEPLKGVKATPSLASGVAFIAFDQGPVIRDASAPAKRWKPAKSVADFEKAVPSGTRVLAYPREMPSGALTGPVRAELGLSRPVVYRLLTTLLAEGFVRRDSEG
ncbi:helix-turn-helix domain-containing protein, partial [Nonomuraea pusilla]|uniref:helix-turn-helix domain-containing protein n=1 Tax=Nonomuraea pusilla TaxID=46177 RepID=UPI00343F9D78